MDLRKKPKIISVSEHGIYPERIHAHAIEVIKHLNQAGFEAYLVGGGIRDLLLGKIPKDFDVATNAHPREIKALFRNCRLIGRRFRLAHIYFGRDIVEVATFRAGHETAKPHQAHMRNGMLVRDNVFGTLDQDAIRRDLTINTLYYDVETRQLLDFCNGYQDIQHKKIRIIGDAKMRYQEDPVRMLRAIRFAGKLNFKMTKDTAKPILKMHALLCHVPPARLFEETIKLFHSGAGKNIYPLLLKYKLFQELFPLTNRQLKKDKLIIQLLENTDKRIQQNKPVMPYFLFASLLWIPLTEKQKLYQKKQSVAQAFKLAVQTILDEQQPSITIPRRITTSMRHIWHMQHRLEARRPQHIYKLLHHPKFRAAYDLLLLRATLQEVSPELVEWWTEIQTASPATKKAMIQRFSR